MNIKWHKNPTFSKYITEIKTFLLMRVASENNVIAKINKITELFCEVLLIIYDDKKDFKNCNVQYKYNVEGEFVYVFLYKNYRILENVDNVNSEITLAEAKKINKNWIYNNNFIVPINFRDDLEHKNVNRIQKMFSLKCEWYSNSQAYEMLQKLKNQIITGIVDVVNNKFIKIKYQNIFAFLPKTEQIPREIYETGQVIEAIVQDRTKNPKLPVIVLSRNCNEYLAKVMCDEIPEIQDNIIVIKKIARFPGYSAKVGIISNDNLVDAIGSCIGVNGERINNVSRRLKGEKIHLFLYSDNLMELLTNLVQPIEILKIIEIPNEDKIKIVFYDEDVIKIIGPNGSNIKLISEIVNKSILVMSLSQAIEEEGFEIQEMSLDENIIKNKIIHEDNNKSINDGIENNESNQFNEETTTINNNLEKESYNNEYKHTNPAAKKINKNNYKSNINESFSIGDAFDEIKQNENKYTSSLEEKLNLIDELKQQNEQVKKPKVNASSEKQNKKSKFNVLESISDDYIELKDADDDNNNY